MVGAKRHHIHQTRQYTTAAPISCEKLLDELDTYMRKAHDYSVKRKTVNYTRGKLPLPPSLFLLLVSFIFLVSFPSSFCNNATGNKSGAHVNFVPKYEVQLVPCADGFIIALDFYQSMYLFVLLAQH